MRRLKVERALTLIHQPGTSLAAVAYECGFADQSHFGRVFREMTGFQPVTYKQL
jgi:AraC family transcriptional regulator